MANKSATLIELQARIDTLKWEMAALNKTLQYLAEAEKKQEEGENKLRKKLLSPRWGK